VEKRALVNVKPVTAPITEKEALITLFNTIPVSPDDGHLSATCPAWHVPVALAKPET